MRAFSMAMAAAAASATVISSSTSVKLPPPDFSQRYRLPNISSRIRMGTPRNDVIGGWSAGKPKLSGWAWRSGEPQRPRVDDEQSRGSRGPRGRWPIARRSASSMPTGDELDQARVGVVEHAERAVARVDELGGELDDAVEDDGQAELGADGDDGVEQPPQAVGDRPVRTVMAPPISGSA